MSKQTAVQWFISVLSHNDILDHKKLSENKQLYNLYKRLKQQAEEMHRKEILESRQNGLDNGFTNGSWNSNLYYQETFNKTKQ